MSSGVPSRATRETARCGAEGGTRRAEGSPQRDGNARGDVSARRDGRARRGRRRGEPTRPSDRWPVALVALAVAAASTKVGRGTRRKRLRCRARARFLAGPRVGRPNGPLPCGAGREHAPRHRAPVPSPTDHADGDSRGQYRGHDDRAGKREATASMRNIRQSATRRSAGQRPRQSRRHAEPKAGRHHEAGRCSRFHYPHHRLRPFSSALRPLGVCLATLTA